MDNALKDIARHIERRIGPIGTVFREAVSDDLHIDVHHVPSSLLWRLTRSPLVSAKLLASLATTAAPRNRAEVAAKARAHARAAERFHDDH